MGIASSRLLLIVTRYKLQLKFIYILILLKKLHLLED